MEAVERSCEMADESRAVVASRRYSFSPSELMSNDDDAFFGPDSLFARLQDAQDSAFEELEARITIANVVGAAMLKGIVKALCEESSESLSAKDSEIKLLKESLDERDEKIIQLEISLQLKEDEWAKSIEESVIQRYKLMSDFFQEMERSQRDFKAREMYVAEREKEVSKMAEDMARLAWTLDAETKKAAALEKKLKETCGSEAEKSRQIVTLTEEINRQNLEQKTKFDMFKRKEIMNQPEFADENNGVGNALNEKKYERKQFSQGSEVSNQKPVEDSRDGSMCKFQKEAVDSLHEVCHGDEILMEWNEEDRRTKKHLDNARWDKVLRDQQADVAKQKTMHKDDLISKAERLSDTFRECSNANDESSLIDGVRAQEWRLQMEIDLLTTILESYSDALFSHSIKLKATEQESMPLSGFRAAGMSNLNENTCFSGATRSSYSTAEAPKDSPTLVFVAEEAASSFKDVEHIRDLTNVLEQSKFKFSSLESELEVLEWRQRLEISVVLAFTEALTGYSEHKHQASEFLKKQLLEKEMRIERLEMTLDEINLGCNVETAVWLSFVDGYAKEMLEMLLNCRGNLSLKDADLQLLSSNVDYQKQMFEKQTLVLSTAKNSLCQLQVEADISKKALEEEQLKVMQLQHKCKEQETVKEHLDKELAIEVESLKMLREDHIQQQWLQHLEIEILVEVFECKYKDGIGMIVPSTLSSIDQVETGSNIFHGVKPEETDAKSEVLCKENSIESAASGVEDAIQVIMDGKNQCVKGTLSSEKGMESALIQLKREMSEIKRERDSLVEQQTEEIFKLKRELLKGTEKLKIEDPRVRTDMDASKRPIPEPLEMRMDKLHEQERKESASKGGGAGQRDVLSESKPKFCPKEITLSAQGYDDEQMNINSCMLLQAEEEPSVGRGSSCKGDEHIVLVSHKEIEKLKQSYLEALTEKESALHKTLLEKEEEKLQKFKLEIQLEEVKNEAKELQKNLSVVHKQTMSEVAGQERSLLENSLEVSRCLVWRLHEQIIRLEGTKAKVENICRHRKTCLIQDSDYRRRLSKCINNLQRAEEEVDLLGDEVDALLTVIEKVFTTLERYHPVFQHCPGMVELAQLVRHEISVRFDSVDCFKEQELQVSYT